MRSLSSRLQIVRKKTGWSVRRETPTSTGENNVVGKGDSIERQENNIVSKNETALIGKCHENVNCDEEGRSGPGRRHNSLLRRARNAVLSRSASHSPLQP